MTKSSVSNSQHLAAAEHVTVGQASKYLGVSIDTIRRWEKAGKLTAHRLDGKNRHFLVTDLERFKATQPLSTLQVADMLGLSASSVRRLEHQGVLKPTRDHNGKRLYSARSVNHYIESKVRPQASAKLEPTVVASTAVAPIVTKKIAQPKAAVPIVRRPKLKFNRGFGSKSLGARKLVWALAPLVLIMIFLQWQRTITATPTASQVSITVNNEQYVPSGDSSKIPTLILPSTFFIQLPNSGLVINLSDTTARGAIVAADKFATKPVTSDQIAEGGISFENLSPEVQYLINTSGIGGQGGSVTNVTNVTNLYQTNATAVHAGLGLTGVNGSNGLTLNINPGATTEVVSNNLEVKLSGGVATSTTSSGSGLEATASGMQLLGGCGAGQVLQWTGAVWSCATVSAGGIAVEEGGTTVTPTAASLNFAAADFVVTDNAGQANISIDNNAITTAKILNGNVTNAKLQNSALSVNAGTGLTGGGSVSLGGSTSLSLANTTVTANSYGSSNAVATFTVDAQGRLTAAGTTTLTNAALQNSSVTINNGTNVTGGGAVSLGGSLTLSTVNNPVFSTSVTTPLLTNGGQLTLSTSGAGNDITLSSADQIILNGFGAGVVRTNASGALSSGAVVLGTDTSGNYVATLGTLTGLTATGNGGAGSTPTLEVLYGAASNTAAQGNTALSFTGSGNLTGTVSGTAGGGFTTNTLAVVGNPSFSGLVTADGGLAVNGQTVITSGRILQNVTADTGILTSGTLGTARGGTGLNTYTANGVLYASTTSALAQAAGTTGQMLLANGSNVPTFTSLGGDVGSLTGTGVLTIANDAITTVKIANNNVTNAKLANSSLTVSAGTGLSGGGGVSLGGSTTISLADTAVIDGSYGSSTAVPTFTVDEQGRLTAAGTTTLGNAALQNSSITINNGTNLTGGGSVALGDSLTLGTAAASSFGTSVTTPLVTNGGQLTVSATGVGNDITFSTADQIFLTGFNCSTFDNGGALTVTAAGALICQNDDGGAAGTITGSGTTDRIPLYNGSGSLGDSWLLQSTNTLTLDSGKSFELVAGDLTVTSGNVNITGDLIVSDGVTFSGLNAAGVVHTNASGVLSTSAVVLGTDTSGDYVASLGSLTGLSATGNSGAGSTPTLSVLYGASANMAVQGNTQLTLTAGTGLSGGGTITLGSGGSTTLNLDINGLNAITTTDSGDYLPIYDASGAAVRKITRSDFLQGITGALLYKGTWDASANSPALADGTGVSGWMYAVSVAGTQDLGSGNITFGAGDFVIHNGTIWQKAPSASAVTSVYNRTGAVVAQGGDYTASQITNVAGGNIVATNVQTAINELDSEKLGSLNGLTAVSQTFANDTNVTISSAGSTHTIGWSGTLSAARGGTGLNTSSSTGIAVVTGGTWSITSTLSDAQVSDTLTASNLVGSGSTTNAVDLATAEVAGNLRATNLQNAAADLGAANVNVNLTNTNGAFVTNLTLDGTVTAATFSGVFSGNATTATALAADPSDCSANQFANAIAANGNLTCAAITDADVSDTLTASNLVGSGSTTNAVDLATAEVAGNLRATNLQNAAADLGAANVNINLSNTNGSFVTNLTLDGTITAATFSGALSGNATSATALAANPNDCSANQFATTIAANGNLTCAAITDGDVPNSITIDLATAASALATNPNDCSANQFATTIAANGNLTCAAITDGDVPNSITIDLATTATNLVGSGSTTNAVDLATAEVAGNLRATNLQGAAADLGSADVNIILSNTNGSFVTNLTLDGTITAATFSGAFSGNATTATALAANPSDCSANQFATTIAANGNLTCAALTDADVPNSITVDLATNATTAVNLVGSGSTTNAVDLATAEVAGNLRATNLQNAAADLGAANVNINLSNSNGAFVTNLTVDGTVTAATFSGAFSGNATTATALAADPTDCAANQFATTIAASGNLTCASITDGDVPNSITIDLATAATALAANPTDCSANQFATTIAASGNLTCAALTDGDIPNSITIDLATNATTATNLVGSGSTTNAVDLATAEVAGNLRANNLQSAAADLGAADVNVVLSNTNGAFVTNLTLDGTITAATFSGALSGNATTASALAANPNDCSANQFATTIAANGNLTCAALTDADVPNSITIDLATNATTATNLVGSGSTSNAVDLATAEVAGNLRATNLQNAAADLGAANVSINLGNTNGSFNTSLTLDGTITAGSGLTVSGGGISVTGNSTIAGTLGSLTGLTLASGSINVNSGGITNAGSIGGVAGLTFTSGGLNLANGGITNAGAVGGVAGLTVVSGGASITGLTAVTGGNVSVTQTGAGAAIILDRTDGVIASLKTGSAKGAFLYDSAGSFSIGYDTRANIAAGSTAGTDVLTALSSGNVGIGDSTPVATFTVGNGDLFQVAGASGNLLTSGSGTFSAGVTVDNNSNFLQTGTGTFGTGTGAVSLNGDVTIASGKNFLQSGAGTFGTGTGAVSLNGHVTIASGMNFSQAGAGTFSTGTGAVTLNGNVSVAAGRTLTINGGTPIAGHLSGTATNLVSASVGAEACVNYGTITVTGAAVGDSVEASPWAQAGGIETVELSWNAVVTAANTVTIRACNGNFSGAIDTANTQEWRADVWKH